MTNRWSEFQGSISYYPFMDICFFHFPILNLVKKYSFYRSVEEGNENLCVHYSFILLNNVRNWYFSCHLWGNFRNIGTLAKSYTVYAIDHLGFGASDKPAGYSYTMEAWAQVCNVPYPEVGSFYVLTSSITWTLVIFLANLSEIHWYS